MSDAKPLAVLPRVLPRDAAALVLIDGKGARARVLLGKRHPSLKFMPGKFVFPGGRLERGDRAMTVAGPLDSRDEARLTRACAGAKGEDFARALALAAIRECFEETGLALGVADYGGPARPPACWRPYGAQKLLPDLQCLHFAARAITPPMRPKRFDTRFFIADAKNIAARVEGVCHEGAELTELVWAAAGQGRKLRHAGCHAHDAEGGPRPPRRQPEPLRAGSALPFHPGDVAAGFRCSGLRPETDALCVATP